MRRENARAIEPWSEASASPARCAAIRECLVAAVAHAHGDAILTTDPDHLRALADHSRGLTVLAL